MEVIISFFREHFVAILSILFSGLGVNLLFGGKKIIKKKSKDKEFYVESMTESDLGQGRPVQNGCDLVSGGNAISSGNGVSVSGANDVIINVNDTKEGLEKRPQKKLSLEERKAKINILFIDDLKFDIVNILKKNEGWINTKLVKDITSLNDPEVIKAHIIFVDVNGVGTQLYKTDQGLGLAKGIKEKYPQKKVVIYSAEQKHDAFKDVWDMVDGKLSKNADAIQFYTKIENLSEEVEI